MSYVVDAKGDAGLLGAKVRARALADAPPSNTGSPGLELQLPGKNSDSLRNLSVTEIRGLERTTREPFLPTVKIFMLPSPWHLSANYPCLACIKKTKPSYSRAGGRTFKDICCQKLRRRRGFGISLHVHDLTSACARAHSIGASG